MPARTPKACRLAGCFKPTTESHGYCIEHAGNAIGWRKRNERLGTAEQRGYGSAWRKLRARILNRDNYLCRPCADVGIATPATAVDHIKPKALGGTDDASNLQSICDACHALKTQHEASAGCGGRSKG